MADVPNSRTDCECCERGSTPIVSSHLIRARAQEGWANASYVSAIGLTIADEKGYTLADFEGLYRTIVLTLAYPILDASDSNNRVGTWYSVSTFEHTGDDVVAASDDIVFTTDLVEDSDPIPPLFVSASLDYTVSDIAVSGEITAADVEAFIRSEISLKDFTSIDNAPAEALEGQTHGLFMSDAYGIAREAQWQSVAIMEDYESGVNTFTTYMENGDLSISVASRVDSYDTATESASEGTILSIDQPWNNDYKMFSLADPSPPVASSSVGWNAFPSLSVETWYSSLAYPLSGDLWPLLIVT
jgi:hypothetical protein